MPAYDGVTAWSPLLVLDNAHRGHLRIFLLAVPVVLVVRRS